MYTKLMVISMFVACAVLSSSAEIKLSSSANQRIQIKARQKRSTCSLATSSAFTTAQQDDMVTAHNDARTAVSASDMWPMEWDTELARMAQYTANTCTWGHANTVGCDGDSVGQNIYGTSDTSSTDYQAAVVSWDAEKENYTLSDNSCVTGQACGHHTQVVWSKSTKVGCGYKACSNYPPGLYIICNYSPAGNMGNNKPYRTGTPCSSCASPNGLKCTDKLCYVCLPESDSACTCSRTCGDHGTLDSDTCTCTCDTDYYGEACDGECIIADKSTGCSSWKTSGFCENSSYRAFMEKNCFTTCDYAAEIDGC